MSSWIFLPECLSNLHETSKLKGPPTKHNADKFEGNGIITQELNLLAKENNRVCFYLRRNLS